MTTHRMTGTPEYRVWRAVRNRCRNPRVREYPYYGGRGITMSERWDDFAAFYADMGPRPAGTTIERIDNEGPYSPENCRWATPRQQARNRRNNVLVDFRGKSMCVTAWAIELNMPVSTLWTRILRGWDVERALTHPVSSKTKGKKAVQR